MTQFNSFNNSSGSGKNFFGAMLVIALALHAAVLVVPTGANTKGSNSAATEEKKDNSQDKVQASPSPQATAAEADADKISAKSAPRKSPTPVKSLAQSTKPKTPSKATAINSKLTTSKSASTPRQSTTSSSSKSSTTSSSSKSSTSTASNSKPVTTTASNSTSTTTTTRQNNSNSSPSNSRQGQNSQNATAKNPQNQTSQSSITTKPNSNTPAKLPNAPTQPTPTTISINNFYKGIPYYLGSFLTSGGILKSEFNDLKKYAYIYNTSDSLEKVAKEFKQQLETQGFKLTEAANESNFQVYKFSKDGKEYFLHLVNKNNRTAIFIDEKSYKLDDLEYKPPEKKLPEIVSFYDTFKANIRDKAELQLEKLKKLDLDALYQNEALKNLKTETVEIDRLLLDTLQVVTPSNKPIEMKQLLEMITTELGKGDKPFTVTKVEGYGGDNLALYEVTQGEFKIYMILLSTSDIGKVVSQTDKIISQGDKLPSQNSVVVGETDKGMRTAILFSQKDPR